MSFYVILSEVEGPQVARQSTMKYFARASTSLSLTKMSITQSNKKNLLHLQNLRETFS